MSPAALERSAERVYRALLKAYPGGFARVLETEMALAFRERCRAARQRRGPWGVVLVLARESFDLVFNAVLEWTDAKPTAPRGDEEPMEILLQDLRYAVRSLAMKPAFAAVSALVLALAIGGTTGIYTLIDRLLLEPPPGIGAPEELAGLSTRINGATGSSFSYPDFEYLREHCRSFSDVAAGATHLLDFMAESEPVRIVAQIVSESYFSALRVDLAMGRGFLSSPPLGSPQAMLTDDAATATSVVISHGMWRQRFGSDPAILGSVVHLNGHPFTVVGVAPEGFRGFRALDPVPEVWVPFASQPFTMPAGREMFEGRGDRWLALAARRAPGVTQSEAQAGADVVFSRLVETFYPQLGAEVDLAVEPHFWLQPAARQRITTVLSMLMAVVGLVLVIACANLAGLLLSRAAVRRREIGIRLAMGASRGRMLRLLLTESVLVSVAGGVLGLLVSGWVARFVVVLSRQPITVASRPDLGILAFALGVALLTGLLFGLAPALHASRRDVSHALRDTPVSGSSRFVGRGLLVVAQVALSVVLLVASGLFVRSLLSLQSVDPGFDPEGLVVASVDLRPQGYGESEAQAFYRQLLDSVGSRPGVDAAAFGLNTPLNQSNRGGSFAVEGREPTEGVGTFDSVYNVVGPGYFKTLGIPLVRGREFTFDDTAQTPGVVVVSESLARRIWPEEEALGKRILRYDGEVVLEVVGVVRDVTGYSGGAEAEPAFYRSILQRFEPRLTLMVRASGDGESIVAVVREEVRRLNPNLPVYGVHTLDDAVRASAAPLRTNATLTSLFGVLALVLASVGIYGLIAYSVTQRQREIGIRMALGARRGAVVRLVIVRGLVLTGLGLILGLVAAGLVTRFLRGLIFAVSPIDPAAFAAAAAVLAAIALLACYLPARRASRVDPVDVLRVD